MKENEKEGEEKKENEKEGEGKEENEKDEEGKKENEKEGGGGGGGRRRRMKRKKRRNQGKYRSCQYREVAMAANCCANIALLPEPACFLNICASAGRDARWHSGSS